MHKQDQRIYLIINCFGMILVFIMGYLLFPLIKTGLFYLYNALSPFLFGGILSFLIYPLLEKFYSKKIQFFVLFLFYLGLFVLLGIVAVGTIPKLWRDFNAFLNYLQMDIHSLNFPIIKSLHVSSHFILLAFNSIIVSLFMMGDFESLLLFIHKWRFSEHFFEHYRKFIAYFYPLCMHLVKRMIGIFLMLQVTQNPYALVIALGSWVSIIPILGNGLVYGLLLINLVYQPLLLIPILILIFYDLVFYKQHPYSFLKMLIVLVSLRVIEPMAVFLTLIVYFSF